MVYRTHPCEKEKVYFPSIFPNYLMWEGGSKLPDYPIILSYIIITISVIEYNRNDIFTTFSQYFYNKF